MPRSDSGPAGIHHRKTSELGDCVSLVTVTLRELRPQQTTHVHCTHSRMGHRSTGSVQLADQGQRGCGQLNQTASLQWTLVCSLARGEPETAVKGSSYSITEHRVLELIPVLGSQPAGDVSHTPGGRLPLLSARPAVIFTTLKRAATNFAAW